MNAVARTGPVVRLEKVTKIFDGSGPPTTAVRDVTFDEDRCRARTGHGAQLLACLRNLAISLLRLANADNIAAARRDLGARPALALRLFGL